MNEPERVTREQALEAVDIANEVRLSVDVFTVADFVRVTKLEVRELIARRQGECVITVTHGGAKVWFESIDWKRRTRTHFTVIEPAIEDDNG